MGYRAEVTTKNNKKVIEELKDIRELINFLWLAERAEVKEVEIHKVKEKRK